MFGASIIEDLEKKLKPVLEESRRQHKIGVVLQAASQLIAAQTMRGHQPDRGEEAHIIEGVIESFDYISKKIK